MERSTGLGTSRWLDAIWDPNARLCVLPGGIDMLDTSGDGDARLICADLGNNGTDVPKLRVFKGADQIMEHRMTDAPCGVVGFYTANGEEKSATLAVAGGSSIYIFKNMRPHFKYCLPQLDPHPKEQEIWHRAGLDDDINSLTLADDLGELLKELGAAELTARTLKFLSISKDHNHSFAEDYRRVPLVKMNTVTTLGAIRKDSWSDRACSNLVVGTESGELLILDHRAFFILDKYSIGWPPVALVSLSLWAGDGQIIVAGRDGRIGSVKRGELFKPWETLPAPVVSLTALTSEGAAVTTMDGYFVGFSKKGIILWKVKLYGCVLDMVSLPVPQSGLSLLAISTAKQGVRIYDRKHLVDTIKTSDPMLALKYGRLGQEERAMAMISHGGGLNVKILKRTADFSTHATAISVTSDTVNTGKFFIPKKTRLFVEQAVRERSEAIKIYSTFQQGFFRLRLTAAKRAFDIMSSKLKFGPNPITLQASVIGLGPNYAIRVLVTNVSDEFLNYRLFLICRGENVKVSPRAVKLSLLPSGIPVSVTLTANVIGRVPSKVQIILCLKDEPKPICVTSVILPVAEDDIEV